VTVTAYGALESPVGASAGTAWFPVGVARGALLSPIWPTTGVLGASVPEAWGALESPLGPPTGILSGPKRALGEIASPLGAIRGVAHSQASGWEIQGLPPPRMTGYEYHRDAGLTRAQWLSGVTRQRRRWLDGRRIATVAVELDTSLLNAFETNLNSFGYDWFNLPMVTGDNTDNLAKLHLVRVIDKPSFGEIYGETITASFTVELQDAP
jgi:hypothetical protein